jgi:6-phosphogluconolactonase
MPPITATTPIYTAANYDDLCRHTVEKILSLSQQCIKARGRFTLVLSGGSTPKGVYQLMAGRPYAGRFDWKNIYLFVGDERFVPWTSERSNHKMIMEDLITGDQVRGSHFYPIPTGMPDAQSAALAYEKELTAFFALKPGEMPVFDLMLLGLGTDGHTASLFPHHPALKETKRLVLEVKAQGIPEERVTLTLPVINHSRAICFVIEGQDKAPKLKQLRQGYQGPDLPASQIQPQGDIWWFIDKSALSS